MVENKKNFLIKIIKIFFLFIINAVILICNAEEYYWYDGNIKRVIYLKDDLLATFPIFATSPISAGVANTFLKTKSLNENSSKGQNKTIIYKIPKNLNTSLNIKNAIAEKIPKSAVFAQSKKDMSSLMALPGGIIITFTQDYSSADVDKWSHDNGLGSGNKLPLKNQNMWVFVTAPGIFTLKKANELMESHDPKIISAQPNWWRRVEKK
ncbi:MAG: hypothetical protein HQK51_00055 [Oligoflexia bacterium]|nr:hypothetical protein [Oligoflexia bacterium]